MHETAIQELDRAALAMLQALDAHSAALAPYLESDQLSHLQAAIVGLRRALLGAQMGALYWETSPEVVEGLLSGPTLTLQEVAARAAELRDEHFQSE